MSEQTHRQTHVALGADVPPEPMPYLLALALLVTTGAAVGRCGEPMGAANG